MTIKITAEAFDPYQEIQAYQNTKTDKCGAVGATSIFIGTMRDFNDGDTVKGMTLEYYPGMTEKQLELCIIEAQQHWQLIDSLVIHRVGDILPADTIVLVAVWSSHRVSSTFLRMLGGEVYHGAVDVCCRKVTGVRSGVLFMGILASRRLGRVMPKWLV